MKMKVYEKLVGSGYEPILVRKLKKGDVFKICEGRKYIEGEDGCTVFVATSDPYLKDREDGDGQIWTIDYDINLNL